MGGLKTVRYHAARLAEEIVTGGSHDGGSRGVQAASMASGIRGPNGPDIRIAGRPWIHRRVATMGRS
jgi:hypothetical protein